MNHSIGGERPRITVLYGSQTGTAQDVAERIAREAKRRHFGVHLAAMDDYDRSQLVHGGLAIFVCSTMGQGEEPDNMKSFWRFLLRKSLPADILSSLEHTVFALGDSSYEKFNHPGKKLYKRLQQLGARSFYPKGEGDDQHYLGIDGTLDPWLNGLWQVLTQRHPLPASKVEIPEDVLLPPKFRLAPVMDENVIVPAIAPLPTGYATAKLTENTRLTADDHFQDVRHVEIALPDPTTEYAPGDIASILPENDPARVQDLLELMGWDAQADDLVVIESNDPDYPVPSHLQTPTTLRTILTKHLSPWSLPRRYFFRVLSHFASDEQQREKLVEFDSAAGQEELLNYCHRPRRHTVEVIRDFFSLSGVPADYCFELFPAMAARQYSIASWTPGRVALCVALVKFKTKLLAAPREGVCSRWLRALPADAVVPTKITRGTFLLPPSPAVPIVCIGPGTGVAPMVSLLEARVAQGAAENYLFFGCRSKRADDLYRAKWDAMREAGQLHVFTAYSRHQPAKVYVQHVMLQNSGDLFDLVFHRGAVVYLSGSSNQMPRDVTDALTTIVQTGAKLTRDQAVAYIDAMKKARRFQEETWS
ncbi:NAPDH-dependent diflavin reductase [Blastocladiella emersonii ATCC 22665]|nr:NAPDH-dependent diflavin reductase [Blastocladiella emersonii ATCC 22665]